MDAVLAPRCERCRSFAVTNVREPGWVRDAAGELHHPRCPTVGPRLLAVHRWILPDAWRQALTMPSVHVVTTRRTR